MTALEILLVIVGALLLAALAGLIGVVFFLAEREHRGQVSMGYRAQRGWWVR